MKKREEDKNPKNVLSFSDAVSKKESPEKSDENNNNRFNITKPVVYVIITLAFICILLFITNDSSFNATNIVNENPISLISANNHDFSPYREGYIIAKDGKISSFNTNQELQWEIEGSKTAPTTKANGKYSLTYYNEDNLAIVTNGKTTNRIKTAGNVSFGYVNNNGYCVLFIEESGLKNRIAVYNSKGEQIYLRQNADKHIPFAALSNNNFSLITLEMNLSKEEITSNINIVDIRKKDAKATVVQCNETTVGGLFFYNKTSFAVIGHNSIHAYSDKGREKWKFIFGERQVSQYKYNGKNIIGLVFNDDDSANSGSEIVFYNTKGRKVSSYKTDGKVFDFDLNNNTAMLCHERKIQFINTKGKHIASTDIPFDIKYSALMSNQKSAFLFLSSEEARLIKP